MSRANLKFLLGCVVFFGTYGWAYSLAGAILVTVCYTFVFDEFWKRTHS